MDALSCLVCLNDKNRQAVFEASGVRPLVALLRAGNKSTAAGEAAGVLGNLAYDGNDEPETLSDRASAIHAAGAIPLLVDLLRPDGDAESLTAKNAAAALQNLSLFGELRKAVVDAGAVGPLVSLLRFKSQAQAPIYAAGALFNLSYDASCAAAILDALPNPLPRDVRDEEELLENLCDAASTGLDTVEAATDVAALERALERARLVGVAQERLQRAEARLSEINGDAERRARRESLGLGGMAPPDEFLCPITYDVMCDPVVASDGISYERAAIEEVLKDDNPLSPITREPIERALFPNRNLRKRIAAHEGEVLDFASQAAEVVAGRAVAEALGEQADGGGRKRAAEAAAAGSSSSDRPKRARR